jgi:dihydrofolate reductase
MRRIVMFNQVSADGYFAAPDGNLDWVVQDPAIAAAAVEGMGDTDTVLMGRRTYEIFAAFWPHAVDDSPTAPDPHGGRRSAETKAMAVWLNEATKLVFSKSLKEAGWKNSRLLREVDPGEITALKSQPGKNMILFGSGSIVTQLTRHRLIDEYLFVVSPVLLGSGRSMLSGLPQGVRLELREARSFPTGSVTLRYVLASQGAR